MHLHLLYFKTELWPKVTLSYSNLILKSTIPSDKYIQYKTRETEDLISKPVSIIIFFNESCKLANFIECNQIKCTNKISQFGNYLCVRCDLFGLSLYI